MKKTKKIILFIFVMFIIMPYVFVEANTFLYGDKFEKSYEQINMISNLEYYKVFYYTGKEAKVYYVDESIRAGYFVWFKKKENKWKVKKWECVWSETGEC